MTDNDFYVAMFKHLEAGMSPNQAFEACAFSVSMLGTDPALQAAKIAQERCGIEG